MVKKKGKSKRVTLKDKYKIQRRVVESHRKSRKKAKRAAKAGVVRHEKKKDPGIPNSWPFKQELLREIDQARGRAEEARAERRSDGARTTPRTVEELAAAAAASRAAFEARRTTDDDDVAGPRAAHGQQSRRAYLRECRKVLDDADVILQVLDARDPLGTRVGRAVEDAILSRPDRRMVLVLNKVDLVPKSAVAGWLARLRRSHPTVALRAGLQRDSAGRAKGDAAMLRGTSAIGVEALLGLLKNYARNGDGDKRKKGCVTVGVVGYPNVGKSSIINSLKRSRAVGVSARPGFTTSVQEVVLDRNVRLLDSPGVVFDDDERSGNDAVLLRNCVDVDAVDDPVPAVRDLVRRCARESLMSTYAVPAFPEGDADLFLAAVARRLGRVKRGGVPDKIAAARTVLRDWNNGRIPYYTPVPEDDDEDDDGNVNGDPVVVSEFGAEFDARLMDELDADAGGKDDRDEMDFVQLVPAPRSSTTKDASERTARALTSGEDDEDMEENDGEQAPVDNDAMADAEDYDFGEDDDME